MDSIKEYFTINMESFGIANASIAITYRGNLIMNEGFASSFAENNGTCADTLFAVGSATKSFTSAAAMLLVKDGLLKLDDTVISHMPEFKMYDEYTTEHLTVRDCLAQKSGLGAGAGNFLFYYSDFSQKEIVDRLRCIKPEMGYREGFAYQNMTFIIVGELIERLTDMTYPEFVRKRILDPLGMKNSSMCYSDFEAKHAAPAYVNAVDGLVRLPWCNIESANSSGGLISSASDMIKYAEMQLGHRSDILDAEALKVLHTPHNFIPIEDFWKVVAYDLPFFSYGLSWFTHMYKGEKAFGHGGYIDGMSAYVECLPEHDLGVVVLCNQNQSLFPSAAWRYAVDRILDKGEDAYTPAALEHMLTMRREKKPAPVGVKLKSCERDRFCGNYENPAYGIINIYVEDDCLRVKRSSAMSGTVTAIEDDKLTVAWDAQYMLGTWPVSFVFEPAGTVMEMPLMGSFELR